MFGDWISYFTLMVKVKIDEISNSWTNFIYSHRDYLKNHDTALGIAELLKPYNAFMVEDDRFYYVMFFAERDKTYFLLKYGGN